MLTIVPGPASRDLGIEVAKCLGADVVDVEYRRFPDGESYVRLTLNVENRDIAVIQSTYPPQDTHLIQLLLLIQAIRSQGAKKVIAVVPYMAYARQDRAFRPHEAVSIATVLRLINYAGASELLTVNIHQPEMLRNAGIPAQNLEATGEIGQYLKGLDLKNPVVYAPDSKAAKMAEETAAMLNISYGWMQKRRDPVTGKISMKEEKAVNVEGRDIALVDDIISTGDTVVMAAEILKERGARNIIVACIHPLLIGNAYERLIATMAMRIAGTNTIPSKISCITIAPIIAEALRKRI